MDIPVQEDLMQYELRHISTGYIEDAIIRKKIAFNYFHLNENAEQEQVTTPSLLILPETGALVSLFDRLTPGSTIFCIICRTS